ncbi:YggS family pyridoxal phosphate-dependent enzyme [Winogradskyella sp. A3E31]|uniref:YggS family pyridoxal phosphate-dependent enzyme n=1 Tax=Winogradskyella sp. A3E31 TaxID=3349637 RepID=UPI00398AF210
MSIKENINSIKSELPEHVSLVAVSKTKSVSEIMEAYETGHRIFGENKVQEMTEKFEKMPKDIQWHMIGHVQRNKVKYMAEYVSLIHGVDSLKLLKEINKQAKRSQRTINCLLQIKIAEEESKFGLSAEDAKAILNSDSFKSFENIQICGLMGMATFTEDQAQIKREFQYLKTIFEEFKTFELPNYDIKTLSMGMSGDYELAIYCGSTMVRIGSSIFGARNYD